jgi:hypothetical protein
MSRSTIQDKLTGKTPPRLGQVLALVRACMEYARSIGMPLATEDVEKETWRSRVTSSTSRPLAPPIGSATVTGSHSSGKSIHWDLEPLIWAGMEDMAELVRTNKDRPMAGWLPELIDTLERAGMSSDKFLISASMQEAKEFVDTVTTLSQGGYAKAVRRLLFLCATRHAPTSILVVVVRLRRSKEPHAAVLADLLIDILSGEQSYIIKRSYAPIIAAFQAATLNADANKLLTGIGKHGRAETILDAIDAFSGAGFDVSVEKILGGIGAGSDWHIEHAIRALKTSRKIDSALDHIIHGIPFGNHEGVAKFLESKGLTDEAARVLELKDEPPF